MRSFLLIITTFSLSLYGMEITKKNNREQSQSDRNKELILIHAHKYLENKPFSLENTDKYSKIIDLAEQTKNGLLIAKLIKLCLPPEITQTIINQYLSNWITEKYQQSLIAYKYQNNYFKQTTMRYVEALEDFQTFLRHDGTYAVVPKIDSSYIILWDGTKNWLKFALDYEDQQYSKELISTHCNKNGVPCSLAVLESDDETEENKTFLFSGTNYEDTYIFDQPILHYLFSYDGTLLAMKSDEGTKITIRENTETINGVRLLSTPMNGAITALCSAHKSRTFVAGSNGICNQTLPNLICLQEKKHTDLCMHNDPITCVKFSPDDSRLLTCSYNKLTNYSHLCLWNTSDLNNITLIRSKTYNSKTEKAFFIDNGQKIITIETSGSFHLFNGLTGMTIVQKNKHWNSEHPYHKYQNKEQTPFVIWSNKNKLIFTILNDLIEVWSFKNGKYLGYVFSLNESIKGIGLTIDEKKIIYLTSNNLVHQLNLYDEQNDEEIAFIKQANIIQLYTMLSLCKQNKDPNKKNHNDKIKLFVLSLQSYIQEQQKIMKNLLPK